MCITYNVQMTMMYAVYSPLTRSHHRHHHWLSSHRPRTGWGWQSCGKTGGAARFLVDEDVDGLLSENPVNEQDDTSDVCWFITREKFPVSGWWLQDYNFRSHQNGYENAVVHKQSKLLVPPWNWCNSEMTHQSVSTRILFPPLLHHLIQRFQRLCSQARERCRLFIG